MLCRDFTPEPPWRDKEIRFDSPKRLAARRRRCQAEACPLTSCSLAGRHLSMGPGEVVIDHLEQVEDSKGNNGTSGWLRTQREPSTLACCRLMVPWLLLPCASRHAAGDQSTPHLEAQLPLACQPLWVAAPLELASAVVTCLPASAQRLASTASSARRSSWWTRCGLAWSYSAHSLMSRTAPAAPSTSPAEAARAHASALGPHALQQVALPVYLHLPRARLATALHDGASCPQVRLAEGWKPWRCLQASQEPRACCCSCFRDLTAAAGPTSPA